MNKIISNIENRTVSFFRKSMILFCLSLFCKILIYILSISNKGWTSLIYACAKIFDIAFTIMKEIRKEIFQPLFNFLELPILIILIVIVLFLAIRIFKH